MGFKIYYSEELRKLLLITTLAFLLVFLFKKWTRVNTFFSDIRLHPFSTEKRKMDCYTQTLIIFSCNFIGCIFSIGSHIQFFIWFYYCIPFLVDTLDWPPFRFKAFIVISLDIVYQNFIPLSHTSIIIQLCQLTILVFMAMQPRQPIYKRKKIMN